MKKTALIATPIISLAVFFIFVGAVHASILPSYDFSTVVASNDSNVNFYIGSSTISGPVNSMSVWLGDSTGGRGTTVSLRLTCFADDTTTSQTGCTSASAFTSNSITAYSSFGQEYFFTWSSPITLQVGKYYLLEIAGASGTDKPYVYGASTLQWANQCNFAGLGSQCTGTPYFTMNAAPDWTGVNATSTALTALYQAGASSTLALIQARCTGTGGGIFGEAMCATLTFLFVPDPSVLNGFASLASTTIPSKFPMSAFYTIKQTFQNLTASSTENLASVSIALNSVDPASTTIMGPILPQMDVMSTSSISRYLPDSTRHALLNLETAAVYVMTGFAIWAYARSRFFAV